MFVVEEESERKKCRSSFYDGIGEPSDSSNHFFPLKLTHFTSLLHLLFLSTHPPFFTSLPIGLIRYIPNCFSMQIITIHL